MTFTDAAAQVLRLVGKPLHYKEITDVAIERNLLSHVGKSPEVTMGARLAALVKKGDKENPLVRVKPGVFALREWDQDTIEQGLADRTPALQRLAEQPSGTIPSQTGTISDIIRDATGVPQQQPGETAQSVAPQQRTTPPPRQTTGPSIVGQRSGPGIVVDPATVQTDILIFGIDAGQMSATQFAKALRARGIRMGAIGPSQIRAVTHYGISADDIETTIAAIAEVMGNAA